MCNNKAKTLATAFPKTVEEEITYVCFLFGPQKILKHDRGKVLVTMRADKVHSMYKVINHQKENG